MSAEQDRGAMDQGIESQLTEILDQYWESKAFDDMTTWCKTFCKGEIKNHTGELFDEQDLKLEELERVLDHKVAEVKKSLMDWVLGPAVTKRLNQAIERLEGEITEIAKSSADHKCVLQCYGSRMTKLVEDLDQKCEQNHTDETLALQLYKKATDKRLHKLQTALSNVLTQLQLSSGLQFDKEHHDPGIVGNSRTLDACTLQQTEQSEPHASESVQLQSGESDPFSLILPSAAAGPHDDLSPHLNSEPLSLYQEIQKVGLPLSASDYNSLKTPRDKSNGIGIAESSGLPIIGFASLVPFTEKSPLSQTSGNSEGFQIPEDNSYELLLVTDFLNSMITFCQWHIWAKERLFLWCYRSLFRVTVTEYHGAHSVDQHSSTTSSKDRELSGTEDAGGRFKVWLCVLWTDLVFAVLTTKERLFLWCYRFLFRVTVSGYHGAHSLDQHSSTVSSKDKELSTGTEDAGGGSKVRLRVLWAGFAFIVLTAIIVICYIIYLREVHPLPPHVRRRIRVVAENHRII